MPTFRRRKGTAARLSADTFCPLTTTAPCVGRSMAGMSLSKVLLPAPECPERITISPDSMAKVSSDSAAIPPG